MSKRVKLPSSNGIRFTKPKAVICLPFPWNCSFVYTIKDVSLASKSALRFEVDEPLEFEALRKSLGPDFQLTSESHSLTVTTPTIVKQWKSIQPGDLVRVRFKVVIVGVNVEKDSLGEVRFVVANAMAFSDESSLLKKSRTPLKLQPKISLAGKLGSVEFQLIKQPAKTETSP